MKMMRYITCYVMLTLLAGCSPLKGLTRLQGVWLVDVESTMMEHSLGKQVLAWDDHVTPDNLSRIRYEFRGDNCLSFIDYLAEDDPGLSNKISVYEQDETSVTILIHPEKNGYTNSHPTLDELIKRDPFAAFFGIRGLMGYELTGKDEARLFYVAIDAKWNKVRNFRGIHLFRTDGPVPERKKQFPNNISLENPNDELTIVLYISATDDTWEVTFSTIDQSLSREKGGNKTNWKVYTSRNPKGLEVTTKYRWESGRCEASFIVPYDEDSEGHLNGITYKATWKEKEKANKAIDNDKE